MTSRGLPGFLRRTRRTDFDSSDDDFGYDDDNEGEEEEEGNNQRRGGKQPQNASNGDSSDQQQQQEQGDGYEQRQRQFSRQHSHASSVSSLGDDDYLDDPNTFGPYPPFRAGNSSTSHQYGSSKDKDSNHKGDVHRASSLPTEASQQLRHRFPSTVSAASASASSLSPPRRRPGGGGVVVSSSPKHRHSNGDDFDATGTSSPHDSNNNYSNSQSSNDSSSLSNFMATTMDRKYTYRESQFEKVIRANNVKISELRKLGWNGIPTEHRGNAWKLLLGYLPTNSSRRAATMERKRKEYKDAILQHYDIDDDSRTVQEQETLRQVLVDVPRTAPDIVLFRNERIKRALARLLYIWAMRHPASSYVQGINDLATPLFAVFLSDYYNGEDILDGTVMVVISDERLEEVEADVYWCLTNILAGIQDHYTADQPGVQRMVMRLEELVHRIDGDLCRHLESVGIQFMQFAFKWMNCLLLREFSLKCVIRLWDTYISEGDLGFEDFHVYVCAAFLCQFSTQLQEMGFDELFGFMQQVPTDDWGETEIEMLLSQAYVLSTLFGGSDAHLNQSNNTSHHHKR